MNHQNWNFSWRYGSAEETFVTEVCSAPHWGLWLKPEKAKASHLGVAQKIGYVCTEVLSFFSAYSELFPFWSKCVSYFTIKLFSTFPYICVCTQRNVQSRIALTRRMERKMMVCWTLLSECRSCPLLKPPYAFLESEKHLRSPEGTACSLQTLPPKSTRSHSFCFNRNHQNNPEGLMLKEKVLKAKSLSSWPQLKSNILQGKEVMSLVICSCLYPVKPFPLWAFV